MPSPLASLEGHEFANGRTVVRTPNLCVPHNGQTAGDPAVAVM
jgi:hypothetical protein